MNLFRYIIRPFLLAQFTVNKFSGTGSFGHPQARYIDPGIPEGSHRLKAALHNHHVKQFHESSCSVASVVSVVNALRDIQGTLTGTPLTQRDILEDIETARWKKRMSPEGDEGRRGLPLFMLGDVVKSSLDYYGIRYTSVTTVQLSKDPGKVQALKRTLVARLHEFDPRGKSVLIAHFNQGAYIKALQIPHISPVGGFDISSGTVTMLDVDYLQNKPYTVSLDTFYNGMACDYLKLFSSFGYENGGYVYIRL